MSNLFQIRIRLPELMPFVLRYSIVLSLLGMNRQMKHGRVQLSIHPFQI